jgi:hypothetical protein
MKGENVTSGVVVEFLEEAAEPCPYLIVGGATVDGFTAYGSSSVEGADLEWQAVTGVHIGARRGPVPTAGVHQPNVDLATGGVPEYVVEGAVVGDPVKALVHHRLSEMPERLVFQHDVQVVMRSRFLPQ